MKHSMLSRIPAGMGLSLLAALLLAGCGAGPAEEFKEYGQLESPTKPAGPSVTKRDGNLATQPPAVQPQDSASRPIPEVDSGPMAAGQFVAADAAVEAPQPQDVRAATVRSAPRAVEPAAFAATDPPVEAPATVERKIELLVKEREFRVEGPENALRVSYDDLDLLKVLNMDPVLPEAPSLLPDWLKQLNGKRIRVRGYMYPTFQDTGLRGFLLARDTQICCFGREPKLYDVFSVRMREGKTVDYIQLRPFDVVGVFHISERADFALYSIDDAIVIEK